MDSTAVPMMMNQVAMNTAMSQAMNMFSHYNTQEYIYPELTPLIKPKEPPPVQNNMPHECQECHRRFAQKQTLIQHMTTHTGIKAFQCQMCFKHFTQQGSLQRHMAIHNNERPYPCDVCHKAFRQKSHLTNHAKSHIDSRLYKCNLCSKSFNRADHQKRHMLTHSANRPIYACFFCNKEFKEKYLMKTHIKKKLCFQETTRTRRPKDPNKEPHKEKPKKEKFLFQCDHCYKSFYRSTKEFSNKYLEKYCKSCCPITEDDNKPFTFFEEEVYVCSICNGTPFNKLKSYNRHMALHSEDRKFECEYCHLRFQKKYLLRYHLNVHNNVKDYQCQLCGLQFETMIKLRDHYCIHVDDAEYLASIMKIYQCHHCNKLFVRRTNCVKHVRSHMNLPRKPKGVRGKNDEEEEEEENMTKPRAVQGTASGYNTGNLKAELDNYDSNLLQPIDDDDDHFMDDDHSYDTSDAKQQLTETNYNQGNYYQSVNNYYGNKEEANPNSFNNYNAVSTNQMQSNNYGFGMINQNNQISGNSTSIMANHNSNSLTYSQNTNSSYNEILEVDIKHHDIEDLVITSKPRDNDNNPAPFHCYVCKKKYRHKKQLVRHFQVNHTNDYDRVVCEVCNKEFTHKSSLVEHKLLHLPPKHECPLCQKRFNRKYSLKRHMLLHKNEKPLKCERCPAAFNHKKSLEIHMLKHEGLLPFECNICKKRYVDKGTLSRHYLVHSGERKFRCHICDLRFSQKIHLTKHYLTHDEIEKTLVLDCPVCGKKFYTKFNFARHLETHNKKRAVTCEVCNKTFSFENGYKRHIERGNCRNRYKVEKSKRRVRDDDDDNDFSDEPLSKRKIRKVRKTTKRKKKKVEECVEEEEVEYDDEDTYQMPVQIKAEKDADEDIKNIKIQDDLSDNYGLLDITSHQGPKGDHQFSTVFKIKKEQVNNSAQIILEDHLDESQFSQLDSDQYESDHYIAPDSYNQFSGSQINQTFTEQQIASSDWTN